MGELVVTEFVSVDGVFEDPGGSEDVRARRLDLRVRPRRRRQQVQARRADGAPMYTLLGRVTYEGVRSGLAVP